MNALHIRNLRHRTHIRGDASAPVRARVDSALAALLDDELDAAILAAGINIEEEVCIRRIHVRGKLNLRRSDLQLPADLSLAWVDELRQVIERGGADVVRYRSRAHTMLDMALRVACADGSRIWAWQQLGLWPQGFDPQEFDIASPRAIAYLTQALTRNITTIIPTLIGLSERGGLAPLLRRLQPLQMDALTVAALEAAQLPPELLNDDRLLHVDDAPLRPDATIDATVDATVSNALLRSPLANVIAKDLPDQSAAPPGKAAAILVLLAAEPTLLGTSLAPLYIERTRRTLCEAITLTNRKVERIAKTSAVAETDRVRRRLWSGTEGMPDDSGANPANQDAEPRNRDIGAKDVYAPPSDSSRSGEMHDQALSEETASYASTRCSADTEWGGLLFLLSLIEPSRVLESATADPLLHVRGLRWVLHRLAVTLLPLPLSDAAACAFAGIHPKDVDRFVLQLEPTADELSAMQKLSALLIEALVRLASTEAELSTQTNEHLLHTVCRRSARIWFDPGWIEAHFSLTSVSTAIRRSGLDRDPDWVPWLGAVVRFNYD